MDYATHDLEDAINFRLVEVEELLGILEEAAASPTIEELRQALALTWKLHPLQRDFKYKLKQVVANLISAFVNCTDLVKQGDSTYSPRFRYRVVLPEGLKQLNRALKKTVRNRVIDSPDVQALAFKGERIVRLLFEAMMAEEKLLPENDRRSLEQAPEQRARIVCDYIAGMTDPFAERMYHRLYGSGRDL